MKWKNGLPVFAISIAAAIAVNCGCGSGTPPPPVSVSLSSAMATVQPGATAQFTATVENDSSNMGVNWSVNCSTAPCGSVSPITTKSGVATTYAAPTTPPAGPLTVILTAISVADASKIAAATITVPGITVSVSPSTFTVAPGSSAPFTATVTGDTKGVTWTVSCAVADCGSVSPTTTPSGTATTYTSPAKPPAGNLAVTLAAASVTNPAATGTATITVPGITMAIAPASASVPSGGTQPFTATVSNDTANGGVTWTIWEGFRHCFLFFRCGPIIYSTCTVCGTVSPGTTPSGTAATYTAPAHFAPINNRYVRFAGVFLRATSVTNTGATAQVHITILPISVSVAPPTANVGFSGVQQFTASVTNDGTNSGVNWTLTQNGTACSPTCGTVSPASTPSGTAVTYTGPARAPASPTVTLSAISVEDPTKIGVATITVPVIGVSLNAQSATVAVGANTQFTPTVTNDVTNSGVSWQLTQNGAPCAPACGTVSPASTPSGTAATYTAPAGVPPLAAVTLTATSVADATKSASAVITVTNASGAACGAGSGSESLLKGQYAFLLEGNDLKGTVVFAGSFAADGTGKITGGEEDFNSSSTQQADAAISSAGSSYSVGSDHRGCLALSISGAPTTYFRFALGRVNGSNIATKGHIIEFDDTTGSGTRLADTIRLQDATSFTAASFKGNYAVGLVGADSSNKRVAVAGTFTADGASNITSSTFDVNEAGTISGNVANSPGGTFACCSANGRGTVSLQLNAGGFAAGLVFYMISSSDALLMNSNFGEVSGEAIGVPSAATFTQASLNGASVLRETSQSATGPVVDIALASANGTGAITVNDHIDSAGTFTSDSTPLNYTVAANGRVTTTGGAAPPVLYLYGQNAGFLVGSDPNVSFGILESQAAGPFSATSFSGAYTFGTENPSAGSVALQTGVLVADGISSTSGTSDQSSSAGLVQNQAFSPGFTVTANGTGTLGSGTTAILISGNKLVFLLNPNSTPAITVVEK